MNNVIWPITDALAATPVPPEAPTATLNAMDIILSSSPIVMLVLLILASFSLLTWAILFSKWKKLKRCSENSENFLEVFWSGRSMEHIYTEAKKNVEAPVARVFQAGYKELQKLIEKERKKTGSESKEPVELGKFVPPESSIHNVERAVVMAQRNAVQDLESSMTFLATTSSTAPFIGLFGTVWGIMSSFQNIGAQGGASLAVVAPGIAEALIATAVGLAAAIPATMGYNYFVHKLRSQRTQMENFSGDFLNIVRRNFLAG